MNTRTAHTPGPWRIAKRDAAVISGPTGEIAFCGSKDLARDDANAAFIVEACNNYDRLLAERAELVTALERVRDEMEASGGWVGDEECFSAIVAILAKVQP